MMNKMTDFHTFIMANMNQGVLIVDSSMKVCYANDFVVQASNTNDEAMLQQPLFSVYKDCPKVWLERKIQHVLDTSEPVTSHWQQRHHLFPMAKRDTGVSNNDDTESLMAQNCRLLPFAQDGKTDHVVIYIEDASDNAIQHEKLTNALTQLELVNRNDSLTGIYNRRYWETRCQQEFERSVRYQQPLALLMLDLDNFKSVNDTHGHQAGDEILKQLTLLIKKVLRESDVFGRYGGEEFAILLPLTGATGAFDVGERIRRDFASLVVEYEEQRISTTVSVGVTAYHSKFKEYGDMIEYVDNALYKAKCNGRNNVVLYLE